MSIDKVFPGSQLGQPHLSLHVRLAERDDLGASNAVQGELFDSFESSDNTAGYRGVVASKVACITYRQLDHWARKHIVEPSIAPSQGSGSRRLYSFKDILILAVAKKLLDTGVNLNNVTTALNYLQTYTVEQLEDVIILSDGTHIYECTSDREMVDLMRNGHAVFGISVGVLWHEIAHKLESEESFNAQEISALPMHVNSIDELAERRMRKKLEMQRIAAQRNAQAV